MDFEFDSVNLDNAAESEIMPLAAEPAEPGESLVTYDWNSGIVVDTYQHEMLYSLGVIQYSLFFILFFNLIIILLLIRKKKG